MCYDNYLKGNVIIEDAISHFHTDRSRKNMIAVLESIRTRMHEDGQFILPVIPPREAIEGIDIENVKVGDTITYEDELHFKLHHIEANDGRSWLAVFTNREEYEKGEQTSTIQNFIGPVLKGWKNMPEAGVIINPWGKSFMLTRELLNLILDADKPENHIYFELGDITKLRVDAIVNAANKPLLGGGGVDGAIHRAAGPRLLEECRELNGCEVGQAKITHGWNLDADFIIHTVGPRYRENIGLCETLLRDCYWNSLELAKEYDLHTIAFPAISTGAYGFPKQKAAWIAIRSVSRWLTANPDYGMAVILVCYDQEMRDCYQNVVNACAPKEGDERE